MKDDAISRQAAIDAFMKATSDGDKADWCKMVLEQVPPQTISIDRVYKLLTAKRDTIQILYYSIIDNAVKDNSTDCEVIHDFHHELMILDDILALMTNDHYLTEKEEIYKDVYNKGVNR